MGARNRKFVVEIDGQEVEVPRKRSRADRHPKQGSRGADEAIGMKSFNPSKWQKECLEVIHENDITFVDSVAGCGKSSVALYYACQQYLADVNKKIVFVRSPAEAGKDRIGFLPGGATTNSDEKLGPHFESTKALLEDFIGKQRMDNDEGKRIFFTIPNFALGKTFTNSVYILDESQLYEPLIMKLLLERIGHDTKTIVLGSSGQLYAENSYGRGALRDALQRFFNEDGSKKYPTIGKYKFPLEAIQRHDVVRDVIVAYDNE